MIIDAHQHARWYGQNVEELLADMDAHGIDLAWVLNWEIAPEEDAVNFHKKLDPALFRPDGTHPGLPLSQWQAEALRAEGADPFLGRKLRGILDQPGTRHVELGIIPGLWDLATLQAEFDAEWTLWERTLRGRVPDHELARVKAADLAAIESGERLAFMPVFYALVRV